LRESIGCADGMVATMKKASWILLTVLGVAITLISLVSASRAYNRADDYGSSGIRVSEIAGGREDVVNALRGIRGTSAAMATAYGVLFLAIVLVPYRRGEVWAWWALLAGSTTVLVVVSLRIPILGTTPGVEAAVTPFVLTIVGLLLDVRRLKK
jgi:peptidoglycan/LPS O-acetylase OafA/YrhL